MADSCQPRPRIHITAPTNWLNDPNAPLYFRGMWHVFYQYNPDAPQWGVMRWGHTVSANLLSWTDVGIALQPQPGRADAAGSWSGSVRIIDAEPVFFYTGAVGEGADHEQSVLRAVATDDELTNLNPSPPQPVLRINPAALGTLHQRDPYLVRRGNGWLMLLGTGLPDGAGGAVAVWESEDTLSWHYRGIMYSRTRGPGIETGPVWECPQLIEVDGRWVLLVSVQTREGDAVRCLHVLWFVGELDDVTFVPTEMGILDHGDCFYATAVAEGADSVLLWGWLQDTSTDDATANRDHVGALSIPRELFVMEQEVGLRPAPALDGLWADPIARRKGVVVDRAVDCIVAARLPGVLRVRLNDVSPGLEVGIIGESDHADDGLWIGCDMSSREAWVTCRGDCGEVRRYAANLPRHHVGPIDVEVIVDHSIVEVFICGQAFAIRWPSAASDLSVLLRAASALARCGSADVQLLAKP